jgi:hypothetical protein
MEIKDPTVAALVEPADQVAEATETVIMHSLIQAGVAEAGCTGVKLRADVVPMV